LVENNRLTVNYNDKNYNSEFQMLNIYSLLGTKSISSQENSIDISGLTVGIYFIELITKTGTHTHRLLITR
jgi:Ca2+/H+ antiporter